MLESPLMTAAEAAKYLHIHQSTIYKSAVPVVKIGGRKFYRKEHLDDFIEQNTVIPCQETPAQVTRSIKTGATTTTIFRPKSQEVKDFEDLVAQTMKTKRTPSRSK